MDSFFYASIFIKLLSVLFVIVLNVVIDQERHHFRKYFPHVSKAQPYGWFKSPVARRSIFLIVLIILALIFSQDELSSKNSKEKELKFVSEVVDAVTINLRQPLLDSQSIQKQITMNLKQINQKIQMDQMKRVEKNETGQ